MKEDIINKIVIATLAALVMCAINAWGSHLQYNMVGVTDSLAYTYIQPIDTDTIPQAMADSTSLHAGDTLAHKSLPAGERLLRNKYFQMTYIGVPLVVAGIATQGYTSDRFHDLRNAYVPNFDEPYDDYLQYAPAVATIVLKACGVEGRSSWERMIVSDAFSAVIMAGVTQGLKHTVKTLRPDNSAYNSFPSGHTATAFTCAHILHKEYGCVSPWISVGGYTVATAVGISRQLNNRHWISDVLAGAGIGILATELGYFLADLIYKDKGLNVIDQPNLVIPQKPSQLGLTMGLTLPLSAINLGNGQQLISTTGSRMGVEGAWYINPYVGIGGTAAVATLPTVLVSRPEEPLSIDAATFAMGVYGSIPLGYESRFRFSLKALAGCNLMANREIIPEVITTDAAGFYYELGASLSVVARRNFGANIFFDYGGHNITATHGYAYDYGITNSGRHNYWLHTGTIGISTAILF